MRLLYVLCMCPASGGRSRVTHWQRLLPQPAFNLWGGVLDAEQPTEFGHNRLADLNAPVPLVQHQPRA